MNERIIDSLNISLNNARVMRDGRGPEIDTLIAADTGSDSLMDAHTSSKQGKTTPHLDYWSLKAIEWLPSENRISLAIAVGIDSPEDVEERLIEIGAQCYDPAETENSTTTKLILENYNEWEMTGENPNKFGLTPLCLQAALNNPSDASNRILPLPIERVLNCSNPWYTQKFIDPAMRCFFYMNLGPLLKCIES